MEYWGNALIRMISTWFGMVRHGSAWFDKELTNQLTNQLTNHRSTTECNSSLPKAFQNLPIIPSFQ